MDTQGQETTGAVQTTEQPKALAIAEKGVKTGSEFAGLMSALMSDIIAGRITPVMANATCNASGKLLKIVEMQYKYGGQQPGVEKVLQLVP